MRLLIVSNRLPVNMKKAGKDLKLSRSIGGVATGIGSFYRKHESSWVGWPGVPSEKLDAQSKKKAVKVLSSDFRSRPVFLSKNDVEKYYVGFCNKTIWPLFHYFVQYASYKNDDWEAYKRVNKNFCDAVVKAAKPGDSIWVNDYHLMLLPEMLRKRLPDAKIGFFLHIPFPSFEVFRMLPWRKEIMRGLLGADLIGFHTYDYARHFLSSARRLLGYDHDMNRIVSGDRVIKVDCFPMGIDYGKFSEAAADPDVRKEADKNREEMMKRKIVLSIDRLDYTKGAVKRLEAFDRFLEKNPGMKEKISMMMLAVPSRTGVYQYRMLKKSIDELVGKINGKHSTMGWTPVRYIYKKLPFRSLVALYVAADIALLTPMRDGMNLVAKEFVASKTDRDGVLILSEMAGASKELGEALIVNPNDVDDVADAISEALKMPADERRSRMASMQARLERYDVEKWASDFTGALRRTKKDQQRLHSKKLTAEAAGKLAGAYGKGKKRLVLLDYDGTLVRLMDDPKKTKPDAGLLRLLASIAGNKRNRLVIISGRDRDDMDRWFGRLGATLVAEHGVWMKEGSRWKTVEDLKDDWKDQVRHVIEMYVDRTPRSFMEEKDFSLTWHYRKADVEQSSVRAGELKEDLLDLASNLDLGILEGSKVIEVKSASVNKGKATAKLLSADKPDFVLAMGDDRTDEDIFEALPKGAYTVKVGIGPSRSRFNVGTPDEARKLLRKLAGK